MLAETICSAVSAAGLGIAALTAYRKRFLAATRIAAYALVPVGLVLTGVVQWATEVVFKPTVWAGFGLLGLAWLLFATTRAVERRRLAKAPGPAAPPEPVRGGPARPAVAPAASRPATGTGTGGRPEDRRQPPAAAAGDDFSDIEAILKKHGI
ncbi:hypothetical protein GCM10010371_54660 [Streptomyces subrutilus]|uniref:Cellulose synthase n=1 Tax=Streptomyces subrutilus TaxID=36818 RepID=A0A5P2UV78_9ACTN|nr:hypothetical protein [Streptomyces subrutilus]QEU81421.1 hypothetical protein CP968_26860 [Streptomyces subrutilus]GGZ87805.1 hypothetical protein GCM10010371_54660 [Streptomyces subrutilus]